MTEWLQQTPAFLAALGVLILPGLPVALLARVRGVLRLGIAVAVSVAVVVAASIIAPFLGMRWSLMPVIVVSGLVTLISAVLWFMGRRHRTTSVERASVWAWLTVGVAFAGWVVLVSTAVADPSHPSQLYDGLFHINAVEFIAQTGDASPFHMTMAYPGRSAVFYPTAWHAIVSLVVPAAGSAVAATNVVTVTVIALIWPVALASLASVLFPTHRNAAVWAPLVAFGFSVFPLGFLNWGVLYPNLLGVLLLPLLIALVVLASRSGLDVATRVLMVLISVAAAGATAFGHPSAVIAGIALLVPFALWHMWRLWRARGTRVRVVLSIALVVGVAVLVRIWDVANMTTNEWFPSSTIAQALGEVAFLSPVSRATGLTLGPLAIVGIWRVVKDRQWWVLWAHGIAAFFFLISAWMPILSVRSLFVGIWYDDTTRVASLLAVFGLPLAGLGASVVVAWFVSVWQSKTRVLFVASVMVLFVGAASHLVAVHNDVSFSRNVAFRFDDTAQGLSPDEAAVFDEAASIVSDDSVTIGDPLTGAGLFLAYTGQEVVFPHAGGVYGDDAELLAEELSSGGADVCAAAERLGVDYAFDFGDRLLFEDFGVSFAGLHGLSQSPNLTEVVRVGDAALYQLTGCES